MRLRGIHQKKLVLTNALLLYVCKGAGSYLVGMAVAIPTLNVDGRRHTNNFSKNI